MGPKRIPVSRPRPIESDRNCVWFNKYIFFFTFMAMVVNCTSGRECLSQRIDIVVAAAEKYLGV